MQNQKRYWLREGIIGFFVGILIAFLFSLVTMNDEPIWLYNASVKEILGFFLPAGIKLAILGMLVGWIYGKIKNRKLTS